VLSFRQDSGPGEIPLLPGRKVGPMDIGWGINYNARRCLQARTGWVWQEREGRLDRGCSSGVEHNLAKVGVVGSNPIARSKISNNLVEFSLAGHSADRTREIDAEQQTAAGGSTGDKEGSARETLPLFFYCDRSVSAL